MDKDGVRNCIGNMADTLIGLLHDADSKLMSKCAVDIKVLRNNIDSIEKLLGLGKDGEGEK